MNYKLLAIVLCCGGMLCSCHKKEQKEVLKGVIEVGDQKYDYEEYNGIDEKRIDDLNQEAIKVVEEAQETEVPVINSISKEDLDSARVQLKDAGKAAREYGASRLQHTKLESPEEEQAE